MNINTYKNYIAQYGNFSYILNIYVNDELSDTEKNTIISTIYNKINEKLIVKNITGNDIPNKWRVSNEKDLLHYYSNGHGGILGDRTILEHTKMIFDDIRQIIDADKDKFTFMITKTLTKSSCIM
jgi:hypothetical protein